MNDLDLWEDNGNRKGLFVTIEGVDGAGTTTVSEALAKHFEDSVLTQEPTDSWTGKNVRECIYEESDTNALTDLFYLLGDRVHNVENVVKPAIENEKIVISDRYADSTRAYQPVALREVLDDRWMDEDINEYVENAMSTIEFSPDVTLFLDTSIDDSFQRVDGDEKFEQSKEFQRQVEHRYHELSRDNDRIKVIDATKSEDEVIETCIEYVEAIWSDKKLRVSGDVRDRIHQY